MIVIGSIRFLRRWRCSVVNRTVCWWRIVSIASIIIISLLESSGLPFHEGVKLTPACERLVFRSMITLCARTVISLPTCGMAHPKGDGSLVKNEVHVSRWAAILVIAV